MTSEHPSSPRKKKRKKSSTTKRIVMYESLEDAALLAEVDKYMLEKGSNPFKTSVDRFDAKVVTEKVIVEKLLKLFPGSVASRPVAILDGLVYKMSAPYRHTKFWRFTRRVLKELKKLNAIDLTDYLNNILKKMLKSELRYGLNAGAIRYIAAVLINRAVRTGRLRTLCEQAAFHCCQQLQTGHLHESNLLLLALNADIYDALGKHLKGIVKCYDYLLPLLTDPSLISVMELLVSVKDSFENKSFVLSSLDSFRPIAEICGIDEAEYADLLASTSKINKKRRMKLLTDWLFKEENEESVMNENEVYMESSSILPISSSASVVDNVGKQKRKSSLDCESNLPPVKSFKRNFEPEPSKSVNLSPKSNLNMNTEGFPSGKKKKKKRRRMASRRNANE